MDLYPTTTHVDVRALRAGRDLVLEVAPEHGVVLPHGVLVDDHLDTGARVAADAAAHAALAQWRAATDPLISHDGISLAEIWHSELFAEVFLPAVRAALGTRAFTAELHPGEVRAHGVGMTRLAATRAALEPLGWRVTADDPVPEDPLHPHYGRPPLTVRTLPVHAIDLVGVPNAARGDVLVLAYGTSLPVLDRLAEDGAMRPVVYAGMPPGVRLTIRAVRQGGGWVGRPGAWARARSARLARRLLGSAMREEPALDVAGIALGRALNRGAVSFLARRASATFAWTRIVDRALLRGGARSVLLPFDWDPPGHVIAAVARRRGIPTLALQHGYEPFKVFSPGGVSDFTGVFSAWDLDALAPAHRARARIVGDTRRARPSAGRAARGPRDGGFAVVLFESPTRVSTRLDGRATARHAAAALEGLRTSLPRTPVVLRPHPSAEDTSMQALARELGEVAIDRATPLLELLEQASVCVGATSTATLECALVGTPVVMLNVSGHRWAPPLDGDSGVPVAHNAAELAAALREVIAADPPPGHDSLRRALGPVVDDPVDRVMRWLAELVSQ